MTTDDYVSAYLRQPLRSIAEVCEDRRARRSLDAPACQTCPLRNDRACTHPMKNLVLAGPGRRRRRAGTRVPLRKAA
jgi:hypothetical protein